MYFEVGDIITIRSWESMADTHGMDSSGNIDIPCTFTKDMRFLCGNKYTIISVEYDGVYKLRDIPQFVFSYEMFEESYTKGFIKEKVSRRSMIKDTLTDEDKKIISKLSDDLYVGIHDYYGDHVNSIESKTILQSVSKEFCDTLAKNSYKAKYALRELFRKSAGWDENLHAIVFNGTRTQDLDSDKIKRLVRNILTYHHHDTPTKYSWSEISAIEEFFGAYHKCNTDELKLKYGETIDLINKIAPGAYAPGKKASRVLKALLVKMNSAKVVPNFEKLYAAAADAMNAKKIDFKLFMSINPVHFMTMSNPKKDHRGKMLVSCHSINSMEYSYNNGCSGYAQDPFTFIVFTCVHPDSTESMCNRKTTRQVFAYAPDNGLLLQSRMYDSTGGTTGVHALSKTYRELVQKEISQLEDAPNLWETITYYDNAHGIEINPYGNFGGYPDWEYAEFAAKVSIRNDHKNNFKNFSIGDIGLCMHCARPTSQGVVCDDCSREIKDSIDYVDCDECGTAYPRDELEEVIDYDYTVSHVCGECRRAHYSHCSGCDRYVHDEIYDCDADLCEECAQAREEEEETA